MNGMIFEGFIDCWHNSETNKQKLNPLDSMVFSFTGNVKVKVTLIDLKK